MFVLQSLFFSFCHGKCLPKKCHDKNIPWQNIINIKCMEMQDFSVFEESFINLYMAEDIFEKFI
jgi:hypothetical protein